MFLRKNQRDRGTLLGILYSFGVAFQAKIFSTNHNPQPQFPSQSPSQSPSRIPKVCHAESISRQSLTLESWVMKRSITTPRQTRISAVCHAESISRQHLHIESWVMKLSITTPKPRPTRIPKVCHAESISRQHLHLESWVMKCSNTKPKTFFYVVSTQTVFNLHGFVRSFQDDKLGGGATWGSYLCEQLG